jgi:hypothetical protein
MRGTVMRLGWFLLPSHEIPAGALGPDAGMFFETVNRIWRMDGLPKWPQRWGGGVGWSVRCV